jgi:hypothetical protein
MILAWIFLGVGLTINLVGVFRIRSNLNNSESIITIIENQITRKLNEVNRKNSTYIWRCGTDFYWLEIDIPCDWQSEILHT